MAYLYGFLSVLVVSLVALIGIFAISIPMVKLKHFFVCFIAFSVGILLGDAFLHLLPEAVEESGFSLMISGGLIGGIFIGFIIEKILNVKRNGKENEVKTFARMNLVGDMVHNSIDGIIIGSAFIVDAHLGLATTLAVILHEIPQEIGDFCVLVHGGLSRKKALWYNFLTALTAFLGLGIAFLLSAYVDGVSEILTPISAGLFIYIAASDMIPELQKESDLKHSIHQVILLLIGFVVMYGLTLTEGDEHGEEHDHGSDVNIEMEYE